MWQLDILNICSMNLLLNTLKKPNEWKIAKIIKLMESLLIAHTHRPRKRFIWLIINSVFGTQHHHSSF